MNVFMELVRDAIPFSWKNIFKYLKYKRKLNKFIRDIDNGSPSLGVLWGFSEFIRYSEIIMFYDNSTNSDLFASIEYNPGQSGFKIKSDEYIITVKLWTDDCKVGIDIDHKKGNKLKTNFTFINQQWTEEPDEYDKLFLEVIISIINKNMIKFLNSMIDKKLSYRFDI